MRISDFATEVLSALGRGANNLDTALQARLLPADTPANNPGIVNRAILRIARNWAWRELRVLDTTSFSTTSSVRYVAINTLAPLRQLVSVRLIDGANSRPLGRIEDIRITDQWIPDSTQIAEGHPAHYSEDNVMITTGEDTTNTHCLILNPIPDAEYSLSLRYSKWPDTYASDATPELTQIDDIILNLSISMAYASIAEYPQSVFWYKNNYMPLLQEAIRLETTSPDWDMIWMGYGQAPDIGRSLDLSPWLDPFTNR